jgi:hypothetical protein
MDTVEGKLNSLGSIHIFIGWVSGILSIIVFGIAEEEPYYFFVGAALIFSGYVLGYFFKGMADIIDLLISINKSFKNKSSESKASWDEISENLSK